MSNVDSVMEELKVTKFRLTDTGNAKLIAQIYGDQIRYDHKRGRWLIWDKHIWKLDLDGQIQRFAKLAAEERYRNALQIADTNLKKAVSKWSLRSEDNQKINAAIALLKSEYPVTDDGENWDIDPMLLGCKNGVVDLTTGAIRNGKPEDLITMTTGVKYDPHATCPMWKQFLSEIFNDNKELIDYIQKALGYSLTGMMTEQLLFFCYGSGSNGKSVFISVLQKVLGDYAHNVPFSTFQSQRVRSSTNDLAALELRRFVVSSEALGGKRLDEAILKNISGGDPVTARYLFKEFITFKPHCKIWFFVNHKPLVKDDSYGFWRRVRLIPFTRSFEKDKQDKQLASKLQTEVEGILTWLVQGALLYQKEGLIPVPKAVEDATAEYQRDSDSLADFIYERCTIEATAQAKASDLWKSYKTWEASQGLSEKEMLGSKNFYRKIGEKFKKVSKKQGKIYLGIRLDNSSGDSSPSKFEASDGSAPQNAKISISTSHMKPLVKRYPEASPVVASTEEVEETEVEPL